MNSTNSSITIIEEHDSWVPFGFTFWQSSVTLVTFLLCVSQAYTYKLISQQRKTVEENIL